MKKKSLKSLSLNKKVVSNLDDQVKIKGGCATVDGDCRTLLGCTLNCGGTIGCPPKPTGGGCDLK